MRTKNVARNFIFAAISFAVSFILKFVARTVFIEFLSAEYLGLNGLFTNILTMLSLTELGVGSAIVYSMYKPVAEGDTEKIKSLLRLYKNLYAIIACVVFAVGFALTPFLPYLISGTPNIEVNLYLVFIIYLLNTVIGYFFAYKRSLIFAHQRTDIQSKVTLLYLIFLNVIQIAVLAITKSYLAYIVVMPVAMFFELIVYFITIKKLYPYASEKALPVDIDTRKTITKNTFAMLAHRVGEVVVLGTDSLIISKFLGLEILGIYSNYLLIIASATSLLSLFYSAISSSIGNQIAIADVKAAEKTFNSLNLISFWITGFASIALFTLVQPFISLWIGERYLLDFYTVLMIVISFYFSRIRTLVLTFRDAAGLFWNDRFKPIFESVINLVVSIILVINFGLIGVILGTIISTISVCFWVEPYVLFKNYFKSSLAKYFVRIIIYILITFLIGALTFYLCSFIPDTGLLTLAIKALICLALPNLVFFLCSFTTPEFKNLLTSANVLLKSIKGTKK